MSDYETFMSKVDSRESMRLVKGRDRLPTVIDRHLSKEKVNFSRFNQINRLNSEIEKLHHKIESLKLENEQIESDAKWNRCRVNDQLKSLESEINMMHSSIEVNNERSAQDESLIESSTLAIRNLCEMLGVDLAPIVEIMGESDTNDFNLLVGQLEKQLSLLARIASEKSAVSIIFLRVNQRVF